MKEYAPIDDVSFRGKLLVEELRPLVRRTELLTQKEFEKIKNTDAVVALSAAQEKLPHRDRAKRFDKEQEYLEAFLETSDENRARIGTAIEIIGIIQKRTGNTPPLVLNGEDQQLVGMFYVAKQLGFEGEILFQNSGAYPHSNTKTQFIELREDPDLTPKHITFVSTGYHEPRIVRTANKQLPREIDFTVIPMPYDRYRYPIETRLRGEADRIATYSANGDISRERER